MKTTKPSLKPIRREKARQILISRMISKTPKEYNLNLKKQFNKIPDKLKPWFWSMEEVLEYEVKWFETKIKTEQLFNGVYCSVCNTYGFYIKTIHLQLKI